MKHHDRDCILKKYTAGDTGLEETNAALEEAEAPYHLEPGKNDLTEENRRETVVGYYPEQASGWGLLDTGTGTLDKVHISHGRLVEGPVNEALPDGSVNMPAYVTVCGKTYEVIGEKLAEIRGEEEGAGCKAQPLPKRADLRRRTDLAGRTVLQHTLTGDFDVTYNSQGYAVKSTRSGGLQT